MNFQKGFIVPLILVIAALVVAGGVGYVAYQNQATKTAQVNQLNDQFLASTGDWKTYSDSTIGIEFQYPSYLGNVVVRKTDSTDCIQDGEGEKYAPAGFLEAADYSISFSKMAPVGNGTSSVTDTLYVTQGSKDICGEDLNTSMNKFKSYPDYISFPQMNFDQSYASPIISSIGTDAYQFYSLSKDSNDSMIVVQALVDFVPYAGTAEADEIYGKGNSAAVNQSSILAFVEKSKDGQQVRDYFSDFSKLISSVKLIDTSISQSTSTSSTAWQTYVGNGIRFQYPENWVSLDSSQNSIQFGDSENASARFRLLIATTTATNLNVNLYLQQVDAANKIGYEGYPSVSVINSQMVIIDNTSGIQRREMWEAAGFETEDTYLQNENDPTIYELSLLPYSGSPNLSQSDLDTYQKMISSVKFTN